MKKWIMTGLMIGLTATSAFAWPFGPNKDSEDTPRERARERMEQRRSERPRLSPEQREAIKAQREAIMELGEAARNETDPVIKEALTDQLRVELNKVADKIHARHKERLQKAEAKLDQLRARMEEAEAHRDQMIEKQVERILSGEPPDGPRGPGRSREGARPFGPPPGE